MRRVLLSAALLLAMGAPAFAQEAPKEPQPPEYNAFTKLFRGVRNVFASPCEIPVTAYTVGIDTDVFIGATVGTAAGCAAGCERFAAGIMDIITFPFPPFDRPLVAYPVGKSAAGAAAITAFPKDLM
jgi:putative exosortase-associated protein (TIGR04073 family)